MILFDIAVGNVDRTLKNYGVMIHDDWDCVLAGLYDCATLRKPSFPSDCYTINGITFKTELVMKTIWLYYPEYANESYKTMVRMLKQNAGTIENVRCQLNINPELSSILRTKIDRFVLEDACGSV